MATMIVETNGWYECDGNQKCGGTSYSGRPTECECASFRREGLKINDKRGEVSLGAWLK